MEFSKELEPAQRAYLKEEAIKKSRNAMKKRQSNCDTLLKVISCNVRYLCDRSNINAAQIASGEVQTSLINETISCLKKLQETLKVAQ